MSLVGYVNLASNAGDTFTNAADSDMLMFTQSNSQKILIGINSNQVANLTITSNLTQFSGNIAIANTMAIQGLQITTTNGTSMNVTQTSVTGFSNDNLGVVYSIGSNTSNNYFRFMASNIELARFTGNGNLGIGKSNPTFSLDVVGDVNFTGTLRQNNVPYVGSQWSNVGNTVFLLQSNVGIGCSNPLSRLAIASNVSIGNAYSNIGAPTNGLIIQGNVGIGTSNPIYTLDVNGVINAIGYSNLLLNVINSTSTSNAPTAGALTLVNNTAIYSSNLVVTISNSLYPTAVFNSNTSIYSSNLVVTISNSLYPTAVFNSNTSIYSSNLAITVSNYVYPGILFNSNTIIATSNLTYRTWTYSNNGIYLLQSNVGIGKSNPTFPLDVVGDVNFTGTLRQNNVAYVGSQWSNNSTNVFLLSSNVGIGTAAPNAPLQFANTAVNRKIVLYEDFNNDHQFLGFGVNNAILRYQASVGNSHVFYVATNSNASTELMRITSIGNVGIGTSNPNCLLSVAGGHTVGAAYSNIVPPANGMLVQGNVGIGTSTPSTSLEIYNSTNPKLYLNYAGTTRCFVSGVNGGLDIGADIGSAVIRFMPTGTEKVRIDTNGNVGIGISSPLCALHVGVGNTTIGSSSSTYFQATSVNLANIGNYNNPTSIISENAIVSRTYFIASSGTITASDNRIKKNIISIGNRTINELIPIQYQYIDVTKGTKIKLGFIAQDVKKVIPEAIIQRYDYITDIYRFSETINDNKITLSNHTIKSYDKIRMITKETNETIETIVTIIDNNTFKIDYILKPEVTCVFIIGRQVDDFLNIDTDQILAVAVKTIQDQNIRISILEEKLNLLLQ